ncbi:argininosuccinate lyase [uncultured Parolsenella sp.]|uniref:argininosuccinate lyase n=1 Tax=uncultured Parolsenella sp. TaxID=2083008 RepID=UPI0027DB5CCC|nr:argininosuccinate lyase [uncultured Parolsenella sp.]
MSDTNATATTGTDAPKPLWGGRFSAAPTGELERFGASLPFDKRMWRQDIRGSKAHAAMLAHQGVISQEDADAIRAGLDDIAAQIERGEFTFDVDRDEDIHMAIERVLTENIGAAGGRLHTGRSRNDQTAVDTHLIARDLADEILASLAKLEAVLLDRAEGEFGVVMPGYTHMQPAQPVLLSHHLLAYFWMFNRDFRRVSAARQAANACPLGAAALAGTTYPLDRFMTAEALGFSGPTANSMDSVSDRDYLLDLIYACSVCQVHLSRLCEELVWWSSAEFGFVEMDDAHSTGSSIMPQKKNPDFAELVRGKAGRVVGDLTSLLVTVKGTPLTYDKDLQEDKEPLFDAADTVLGSLMACTGMLATCTFKEERMREASHEGYMAATDLADYLVGKGLPFRQAHAVVGRIVGDCVREGVTLQQLSTDELRSYSELFDDDAHEALDIDNIVRRRTTFGGTGHEAVRAQLKLATEALEADEAALGE